MRKSLKFSKVLADVTTIFWQRTCVPLFLFHIYRELNLSIYKVLFICRLQRDSFVDLAYLGGTISGSIHNVLLMLLGFLRNLLFS